MASLPDMTVALDTSQLDQIVKLQCFANCEHQEKRSATCNLKRVSIGLSGNCMRFEPRTTKYADTIKNELMRDIARELHKAAM